MKTKKEESPLKQQAFAPAAYFSIIQLEIDLKEKPVAQRILQFVLQEENKAACYITENCYHALELNPLMDKLISLSYGQLNTNQNKSRTLQPVKHKIHWCLLTADFVQTGKGPRINPETGELE